MMKQIIYLKATVLSISFMLLALAGHSQDLIVKKNGEEIVGKVTKVSEDSIHYRMLSDEQGLLHFVLRKDVAQLQLSTAPSQKELNQLPKGLPADEYAMASTGRGSGMSTSPNNADQLVYQARHDAIMYYKGQGPLWGTAGATFLLPPVGLVTGIITAAVPPNIDAVYHPNYQLMREPTYRQAFQKQAHKRKVGKAATGFGVGMGALVALVLLLGAS